MNLLFVIDNTGEKVGGGTYSVFKFAEAIAQQVSSVTIVLGSSPKYFSLDASNQKLKIIKRPKVSRRTFFLREYDNLLVFLIDLLLIPYCWLNKIDVIVGYQVIDSIRSHRIGKFTKAKEMHFIFETPDWCEERLGKEWNIYYQNKKIRKRWEQFRSALRSSEMVISNSKLSKKYAEAWLEREDISVVYPGVDLESGYNKGDDKKIYDIIYLGRLEKHKNVHEILKASAICPYSPNIAIVGQGEEKFNLENIASTLGITCRFFGKISDEDKWRLLSQSRLMVYPTSFEGFGIPPAEAIACGVICIASDLPILHEIYGDSLIYFREHDISDLALKIMKAQAMIESERLKLLSLGREKIKQYSWKLAANNIVGLLEKNKLDCLSKGKQIIGNHIG
ncbi:MAG: glycosyltransferase [Bacteroidetes bacterium]|nr:glycosyltransferase [Bacteroidota bacterium]